jgi:phosphoribosylpyrophosphate synthetase
LWCSFADGEVFVKVTQEIRGRDCFIILPTHSNDKYAFVWASHLDSHSHVIT